MSIRCILADLLFLNPPVRLSDAPRLVQSVQAQAKTLPNNNHLDLQHIVLAQRAFLFCFVFATIGNICLIHTQLDRVLLRTFYR